MMLQAKSTSYDQAYYTARNATLRIRNTAGGAVYGFAFCFLTATVVAVWSAYDGAGALDRFFLLLGGILAMLAAPVLGRYTSTWAAMAILAGFTALLTLATAAFYFSQRAVVNLFAGFAPAVNVPFFSDNQAAQILAIGAPLLAALLWVAVLERRWRAAVSCGAVLAFVAAVLLLTGSRGALLGMGAAAGLAVYFWMRSAIQGRAYRKLLWLRMVDGLFLLIVVGALALYVAVVTSPELDAWLGVSAQGGSALSRIALWRDSIPLIADYYFTGSGLGTAAMVYATYTYLLHVPYLYHAHNFYLQVALEQGVPALLAWLGLVVAVISYAGGALLIADRVGRTLLVGGFAALTVFLVHSLFEADLYFSALGGLVFYPLVALLWIAATIYEPLLEGAYTGQLTGSLSGIGFTIGLCAPLLMAMLVPGSAARWEANLGSVIQTQVELGAYERPPWSFQDQVRRQLRAELQPAEMHFRAALQIDPEQPTAHRRLGSLALARGEFKRAKNYLTVAHAVAPYDRAAQQMLGEVFALDGAVAEAVALWQNLDMEQGQLMVRRWWYEWFGEPEQLERLNDAISAYQNTN